jgi:hypothetical protein
MQDATMPTVRCPGCQRTLRLPEEAIESAQCPLCGSTFRPPDPRQGPENAIVSTTLRPTSFEPAERRPRRGQRSHDEPIEKETLPPGDALVLARARGRLRIAASVGLVHGLLCGCTESLASVTGLDVGGDLVVGLFLAGVLVRLAGFSILWCGATAFARRRHPGVALSAGLVAVVLSGWLLLGTVPWWVAVTERMASGAAISSYLKPREATGLVFVLGNGLVAALALIAGLWTFRALTRPNVRDCFR